MPYDPEKHHRHTVRLPGYDYSSDGVCFITICTQDRANLFGEIVDGKMALNDAGMLVETAWKDISVHFPHVELDAFIIMPNHAHGIVGAGSPRPIISEKGTGTDANEEGTDTVPLRITLGQIVAYFKYQSTKRINEMRGTPGVKLWQRNYYEHIIRDDESLFRIREYIDNNPLQWELDRENPAVGAGSPRPLDTPPDCGPKGHGNRAPTMEKPWQM